MGTPGDFREYLVRPCARIDAVDIEEDVVALVFQCNFQRSSKGPADGVSSIADEDRFSAHGITIVAAASSTSYLHWLFDIRHSKESCAAQMKSPP